MKTLILITSFLCFGVYGATRSGKILYPFVLLYQHIHFVALKVLVFFSELRWHKYLLYTLLMDALINIVDLFFTYLKKPFYSCIVCMASVWTMVTLYLFGEVFQYPYPLISLQSLGLIGMVGGVNYMAVFVMDGLHTLVNSIDSFNKPSKSA